MRHLLLAAAVAVTVPLGAAPASAADPAGVVLTYSLHKVPHDAGYLVVAVCNATADPGKLEDIPMATVVTCRMSGLEDTKGMPGREAFAAVHGSFLTTVTICVSGEAVFVDQAASDLVVASATLPCHDVTL